jgi:hypothetical protein
MGWGWLKPIAKIGAAVAAPFTGGASLAALPILDAAGEFAGALGAGRAAGRVAEAGVNQNQDQIAQQRYGNELGAARLNLDAGSTRAGQSVQGDILKNAQDFRFSSEFGGGSTGGLRPSIFSNNTRELGDLLSSQALTAQGTNEGRAIGAPPELTGLPQSGKIDSILNTAGALGSLASLIPYRRPRVIGQGNPPTDQRPFVSYQKPDFTGWA